MPREGRTGEERTEWLNLLGKEKEDEVTKVPTKKRSQQLDLASTRQYASV